MLNNLQTADAMQGNLGFVQSQTAHIETGVYKARFPQIRYPGLIPVDYSAPEWIKTVDYYSMDISGKAEWIGDRTTDIPVVGTELGKSSTSVFMAGIGYDYGIEEVNQALMLGMNLPGEKAGAARLVYERTVDNIAFTGDSDKGFQGLYNNSSVTATSATTGSWTSSVNEDLILGDINELLTGVYTATNEIAMADTLLMPGEAIQFLGSNRLGDTSQTILEFIMKSNAYTIETGQQLTIRSARGLNTAGVGDTRRMVAYRRSPEVLKMHVPMRHRFLPVQVEGLTYKVPGIFRLGGLDIRLPKEVRYSDGI